VNTPLFDDTEIALPAGKFIRVSAPGASNGLTYVNGIKVDGKPTDQTFVPESIIRTGGDVTFSLSGIPNTVWGTAESSAPPSFGAGSAA
jgi:putative alpha-1,2-mannosidase